MKLIMILLVILLAVSGCVGDKNNVCYEGIVTAYGHLGARTEIYFQDGTSIQIRYERLHLSIGHRYSFEVKRPYKNGIPVRLVRAIGIQ